MKVELKEGAQIGRYALLTRIARGGMADVWLARASGAVGFQKTVVIKTILPHLADDPEFIRMFVDEALLAANLEHPNIVHIFDLGEVEGAYFIAMEYIAGRTLRHVLRELRKTHRVPPPWLVLQVASVVCDALQYAHGKLDEKGRPLRLVHRDISPENIMVSFSGDTKVLDFGIAKATTIASKTRVGVLKGKYAYMAPEQIEHAMEGVAPDPKVDIYALGVVMYELITGRRPFRGQNELALLRQIMDAEPQPPSAFCNWVPVPLSKLVLRAMARDPKERFQTAADLREAIEIYFDSSGSFATRRHVADYIRSLFGDSDAQAPSGRNSSTDDISSAQLALSADPWTVEPPSVQTEDSSVTIDLSMVLISDDDAGDQDPPSKRSAPSPHGSSSSNAPPLPKAASGAAPRPSDSPPQKVVRAGPKAAARSALDEVDAIEALWPDPSTKASAVPASRAPSVRPKPPAAPSDRPKVSRHVPQAARRSTRPPALAPSPPPADIPLPRPRDLSSNSDLATPRPSSSTTVPPLNPPPLESIDPSLEVPITSRLPLVPTMQGTMPTLKSRLATDMETPRPASVSLSGPNSVVFTPEPSTSPSMDVEVPRSASRYRQSADAAELASGATEAPDITVLPAAEAAQGKTDSAQGHAWDRVTRKVRDERDAAEVASETTSRAREVVAALSASEDSHQERDSSKAGSGTDTGRREIKPGRDRHDWDAVLGRIKRDEGTSTSTDRQGRRGRDEPQMMTREARALALFEAGIERMRERDKTAALECWKKALEIEPENRLYQSNVRVLARQMSERDKGR